MKEFLITLWKSMYLICAILAGAQLAMEGNGWFGVTFGLVMLFLCSTVYTYLAGEVKK